MKHLIVLLFVSGLTMVAAPMVANANSSIIYESDFSSDPGWQTDQPDNFYWDADQEALFLHASITPSGTPTRHFYTDINLGVEKSFKLSYDMSQLGHKDYSIFTFGLFTPDLLMNEIRSFGNQKRPYSTINFSMREADVRFGIRVSKSYSREVNIYTENSTDGSGGSGGGFTTPRDTWYTVVQQFNSASSTLETTVTDRESGELRFGPIIHDVRGDFSDAMQLLGFSIAPQGETGTTANEPNRLPGAGTYLVDNVRLVQIEIVDEPVAEPEPQLSDLLLKYEPILQFHEHEDYYPMNVDAFVRDSGLWDSTLIDEVLIPRGVNNGLTLDYLATTTVDTRNWYVSFSSDQAGEFELDEAKRRYDQLVTEGEAVPTYYAHQSEHSYIDDLGNEHEFIVLQYWYYYAMNNWAEKGGFNDHEGDWESVFVFLDKETEEPGYVALSAHHNGGAATNILDYDSVLRDWSEAELDGNNVVSYVSAGSHAMYGFEASHKVPALNSDRQVFDLTSSTGDTYSNESWQKRSLITLASDDWINAFKGKFGTDKAGFGSAGIEGPLYNEVSGTNRFLEPLRWAGINRITALTIDEPQSDFDLPSQGVSFSFAEPLPTGTTLSSVPHDELISFGANQSTVNLLPKFWDINLSQPNGTFSSLVKLSYSDEEVAALSFNEGRLGVYFFNPNNDEWEPVPSTVDAILSQVSFITDHFSIYAIGELPEEVILLDDQTGTSTDDGFVEGESKEKSSRESEMNEEERGSGPSSGTRARQNDANPLVLGITSTDEELRRELMLQLIELLKKLYLVMSIR